MLLLFLCRFLTAFPSAKNYKGKDLFSFTAFRKRGTNTRRIVPTFARIAKESFLSESQQKKKTNLYLYNGAAAVGRDLSGDLDRASLCEWICGALALNRSVVGKNFATLSCIYTLSRDIIFFSFCWYTSGYYTMSLKYLDYPVFQKNNSYLT